jgi:chemotaxis protein MotA
MMIVDGSDPELIKGIMETDLEFVKERHAETGPFGCRGGVFPAFGMIGTLIGLINMLKNLSDMSRWAKHGRALVTTFYGTMLANLYSARFRKS